MELGGLIRRLDIAFAALSVVALALGGDAALSGSAIFASGLLPGMAAEAQPQTRAADFARLSLNEEFEATPYTPQVLFPVTAAPMPAWLTAPPQPVLVRFTPPALPANRQPVIAICIDDLGEDLAGTDRAIALPKAVALSFLPFAEATPFLASEAGRKGHTVLAHVPMQPVGTINPGPMALNVGMTGAEITRGTEYALNRVPGAAGINNHEGSRFTADAAALAPVAAVLKARHLFFLDSRTGPDSKVAVVAEAAGVETAGRDVFLDDDPSPAAIAAALETLARQARANGVAIAIGHPHEATLKVVAAWLAQGHGVTLVSLQEAMRFKQARAMALASR